MARARNIKPAIMSNDDLAEIEPLGRLLFIYLWMLADREGRLEDRPRRIKAEALPYDNCDIDELINGLCGAGFLNRYSESGTAVIQIVNFSKHQNPHMREAASTLPEFTGTTKAVPSTVLGITSPASGEYGDAECKIDCNANDAGGDACQANDAGSAHHEELKTPTKSTRRTESQPRHNQGTTKAVPSPADTGYRIPDTGYRIPDSPSSAQGSFDEFWSAYPRKVRKQEAVKVWKKLKPDNALMKTIMDALSIQNRSAAWAQEGGKFIPHPTTWLRGKRWEDELPVSLPQVRNTAPVEPDFHDTTWAQNMDDGL